MSKQDYYKTLGVEKNATPGEIKKAFYKKAQQFHPDKPTGDEAKFKEVNEAYQVLSDEKKKAQYDRFGHAGANMGGGASGFGGFDFSGFQGAGGQGFEFNFNGQDLNDILRQFGMGGFGFGGQMRRRGADVRVNVDIDFKDAILGAEKEIKIPDFQKGGSAQKKLKIQIPAGVENGQRVRLSGYGKPYEGEGQGEPGDVYVYLLIKKHPTLHREGEHLVTTLRLKLSEALLGGSFEIQGLEKKMNVKVPAGTNNGKMLRVKGKGVPVRSMFGGQARGDLVIVIEVDMPTKLSKKAKKAIETLVEEGY